MKADTSAACKKKLYVHASFQAKTKDKHFPTLLVSFLQD